MSETCSVLYQNKRQVTENVPVSLVNFALYLAVLYELESVWNHLLL
jgi:hypothetical protein